jgi:glycosyltransferase involved in cell wall biosynthesis
LAPCFNEADGISTYIDEIDCELSNLDVILFDDCSSDNTFNTISSTAVRNIHLKVYRNFENLGHGRTIRRAWEFALREGYSTIILVDGDGQIPAIEIRKALEVFNTEICEILEGVRTGRQDPWFRKFITGVLRFFVLAHSRKFPSDANTPFRIYSASALRKICPLVPTASPTPNIHVSILTRNLKLKFIELKIETRDRLGDSQIGSTWNARSSIIPSKKFIIFCLNSLGRLITKS